MQILPLNIRTLLESKTMTYTTTDLGHPDLKIRIEAAAAFRTQGKDALPALIAALDGTEDESRFRAAATLGYIGDADAITPLVEFGRDAGYEVKLNCVWALGQIGDAKAIPPLLEIIHAETSESPDIRYEAALALVRLGRTQELQAALENSSEPTYRVAHAALCASRFL